MPVAAATRRSPRCGNGWPGSPGRAVLERPVAVDEAMIGGLAQRVSDLAGEVQRLTDSVVRSEVCAERGTTRTQMTAALERRMTAVEDAHAASAAGRWVVWAALVGAAGALGAALIAILK